MTLKIGFSNRPLVIITGSFSGVEVGQEKKNWRKWMLRMGTEVEYSNWRECGSLL